MKTWAFLLLLPACLAAAPPLKIAVSDYRNRVYASWLGQCVGNVYGLPHENAYVAEPGPERFPYGYGRNTERLKAVNGVFSDDDTDIEYVYLLAMEKFGPEPKLQELAQLWQHHVRDRVWLANRAAVAAIHHGIAPPLTGSRLVNPHWFQIDPQLVNEIWAVTAPGMVRYAAMKSAWAATIMAEGWAVEPTIHYGAMYAAAFEVRDVRKLIDIGTAALPGGSRFARTVEHMKALHRTYPTDWKAARAEMARTYHEQEPLETRGIWNANLNGAAGILALLYGEGDFQRTLDLACAIGFDADNQAATMAGLLGLVLGVDGIPRHLLYPFPELGWTAPFNDFYKNVSRHDMADASLRDMAARMARQGERLILQHGGRKLTENGTEYYLINREATFQAPLELPAGPAPYLAVGDSSAYEFSVAGEGPYQWRITEGRLPDGMSFSAGRLSGTPRTPGSYRLRLQVAAREARVSRDVVLLVRGRNLAASADRVLARVHRTDASAIGRLRLPNLSIPQGHLAESVEVIRDRKRAGTGATFLSVGGEGQAQDFYGYEWSVPVKTGLVGYHTGAMAAFAGWFTDLRVEYRNAEGRWLPVRSLKCNPPLPGGSLPFDKPHYVEYLLSFEPVSTTAIRIIGNAGLSERSAKGVPFTSIAELTVHESQ